MWNVRPSFAFAMYRFYTNVLIVRVGGGVQFPKSSCLLLKEKRGGGGITSETSNQDLTSPFSPDGTRVTPHS